MLIARPTKKAFLVVFLFILFFSYTVFPQPGKSDAEDPLVQDIINDIYNFSFHSADSMLVELKKTNLDKAVVLNINANLAWWKVLSGDEIDQNLKLCNSNIEESLDLLLKNINQDLNSLFHIIYSYSLKARVANYSGNTLNSLSSFYKSVDYLTQCLDMPEKDDKIYMVSGMYLYFSEFLKEKYFLMRALFITFPDGDKARGLNYLEYCSNSDNNLIRTEARYFLMKIYAYNESDYLKAFENVQLLSLQYPDNIVYSMEKLKLLINMKRGGEALTFKNKLLEEIKEAGYINTFQKNHFILQLKDLEKSMDQ